MTKIINRKKIRVVMRSNQRRNVEGVKRTTDLEATQERVFIGASAGRSSSSNGRSIKPNQNS